jgi:serine kinase of HPr protein (carbohydrate metabolism regulator)
MSAIAHQATAVAIGGRGLVIEGAPGSGKSSLALALIDRGAGLIGDDALLLERIGGRLLVSPHPRVAGLIEVRNVGLVSMPVTGAVPLALVVALDPDAPRHVEQAETVERGGLMVPLLRLWPDSQVLALRAEIALERHGRVPAAD